jgi:hypothetical protein
MTCKHCDCDEIDWIDEGIGAYEYWGSKEVDIDMVPVCANCGEPVETTISFRDWKQSKLGDIYDPD